MEIDFGTSAENEALDRTVNESKDIINQSTDSEDSDSTDEDDSDDEPAIVFGDGSTTECFDDWIEKWLPSNTTIESGYQWVLVFNRQACLSQRSIIGFQRKDLDGLSASWENFIKSGRTVNYASLTELAHNHYVCSGKWMFWASSGGKIDHLWQKVASCIMKQQLPCFEAKVSTRRSYQTKYMQQVTNTHVVCIYNIDFTDYEQVMSSEQAIRKMGIKGRLFYKPDLFTHCGVYAKNPWNIKPHIFISDYDILKKESVIQSFV
ncbi:UPF0696 protein C11orf68 homolog [Mya arenaria]|uniref:UPF0696 protein C11orf68 homolog n=1 Tax=Mya arenaria TaxID=6604 RepID=UPI0022E31EC2|nr:UPF0696 protein C11orf68 homolog [Mya arenaria]XP_052766476.1 UPF0696 protein C11orf68 homolog [Mya arenaria]